MCNISITALF